MTQKGFKLTLPSSAVFECTEEVTRNPQGQTQFFIDGLQQVLAFWRDFLDGSGTGTDFKTVAIGVGAGQHRFTFEFTQAKGSTDSWGDSASGDEATSKMDEFDEALATERIDSDQPATLATGEYSSSGKFTTLDVVVEEWNFQASGDDPSEFTGTLTVIETADLTATIDAGERKTDR